MSETILMNTTPEPVSAEQRRAVLANVVAAEVRRGWAVESQTDFQVIFVTGHRPNHILHLILSIITLGVWLIVWALVAMSSKVTRTVVTVDEFGQAVELGEGPWVAAQSFRWGRRVY